MRTVTAVVSTALILLVVGCTSGSAPRQNDEDVEEPEQTGGAGGTRSGRGGAGGMTTGGQGGAGITPNRTPDAGGAIDGAADTRAAVDTAAPDMAPAGPQGVPPLEVMALPGKGRALVTWAAGPGATGFEVERQPGCTGAWTRIGPTLQTLSFVDDQVPSATEVCYRVRGLSSGGRIGVSGEARLAPAPMAADGRAAVLALAARPNPFKSRSYSAGPVPTYDANKLPRPIVEDRPAWVAMYNDAWRFAIKHTRAPTRSTGFLRTYADPVFNDHLFQWDTIFMLEFWRYGHSLFPAIQSLDNFYVKQHEDGFICREFDLNGKEVHFLSLMDTINPPLYAWSEWEHYRTNGDMSRFKDVIIPIVKYWLWLEKNRTRPDGMYWNTRLGSGQDDLMRGDSYAWMDMTTQQAQSALYIAAMASKLGEHAVVPYFVEQHLTLAAAVRSRTWSEGDQFFYDLTPQGKVTGIKTSLAFWPLMARIASFSHVQGLTKHLFDPNVFWRPNVVPVLARGEKGYSPLGRYWNGSVWAPTNHVVVKGLDEYGQDESAARVAERYLDVLAKVHRETGTIWEYYAGESATGQGKKEYGWSNVGPIAFLIEDALGIRASAATGTIVWRPWLRGRNGIEDLALGPARVSLVAGPVQGGKRKLTMSSDRAFRVYVESGGTTTAVALEGKAEVEVPAKE